MLIPIILLLIFGAVSITGSAMVVCGCLRWRTGGNRFSAAELILLLLIALTFVTYCRGEWQDFQPENAVNGEGILADVLSRSERAEYFRRKYADDKATCCHETTHDVNGRISILASRQPRGSATVHSETITRLVDGVDAFYVGDGRTMILQRPEITLAQVIRCVPREHRAGPLWDLYFVKQAAAWRSISLYAVDEWSAAINGWQAAVELGVADTGDRSMSLKFCHYADATVAAVKRYDSRYANLSELEEFVDWQKRRVAQLVKKGE